ncbi:hypothetical protein ACKVMW_22735, partial [Vibrio chagasii]|uniref:hypothetical protein n=1 Tax=Vibrio chagasii TaxID=170679 RepID=UPI003DA16018
APWQSGYAADCKSVDLGSTPGGASIIQKKPVLVTGFFVSGFWLLASYFLSAYLLICLSAYLLICLSAYLLCLSILLLLFTLFSITRFCL